ncbi:MAG: hypothetical protein IJ406_08040 [Oscillospiraceae bacterium]|nr:hypothetical protein [Oscillospiraceae bacterium]
MSTIGNATLQSDENGLVTLQCDRCKSRFKIDCSYLNEELDGDICCPVCGISESLNTFWPEEVIEEAVKAAMMEAEELITQAFNGLNSKHIKVETKPTTKQNRSLIFKNKDYDLQNVTVHCCQKDVALMPADIAAGFYCPYCGRIVK